MVSAAVTTFRNLKPADAVNRSQDTPTWSLRADFQFLPVFAPKRELISLIVSQNER
jgi:hypothetical protein